MKAPLIHKLNDQQVDLVREFLACFVKPEKLPSSGRRLQKLNLDDKANLLPVKKMFLGTGVSEIVSAARSGDGEVHDCGEGLCDMWKVSTGEDCLFPSIFICPLDCACTVNTISYEIIFFLKLINSINIIYLHVQVKIPLMNPVLRSASAIDPLSRGHDVSQEQLLKLPRLVTNVLAPEDCDAFELEIRRFQIDSTLPPAQTDMSSRIDDWWTKVFETGTYPLLSRMVKALLSCFHGPQVESAFNLMGDVLDSRSHRLRMETYSSVMSVKYNLRSSRKTAVQYYRQTAQSH